MIIVLSIVKVLLVADFLMMQKSVKVFVGEYFTHNFEFDKCSSDLLTHSFF